MHSLCDLQYLSKKRKKCFYNILTEKNGVVKSILWEEWETNYKAADESDILFLLDA